MSFTVWDNITFKASWLYNTGGQSFTFAATDESRIKISLDEIPEGKYSLYADITKVEKGCSFSLWQGQTPVSDWITTKAYAKKERLPMLYAGDISVTEFSKSLTVQFKTGIGADNFLLSRLIFVHAR